MCLACIRCVGCKCQNCPQSGGQGLGQGRGGDQVLNPPLVFVIDTTKSVKPDKDSIFNLTSKVTDRIMNDNINIPRWVYKQYQKASSLSVLFWLDRFKFIIRNFRFQLLSFNDYGREINRNVRLEVRSPI